MWWAHDGGFSSAGITDVLTPRDNDHEDPYPFMVPS